MHPLSRFAAWAAPASPSHPSVEGDGTVAAGLPLLGAPELGHVSCVGFERCER